MILILSILLFSLAGLSATNDLCDILKIPNCRGVTRQLRKTSATSIPSTTTAASINPANISFDRGAGLDIIIQSHNPVLFGLSSSTGKMGGALINGSIDNSFFGNRVPELDESRLERELDSRQYRNKKLTLALGVRPISKRNYAVDAGIILKRHPEIKDINPGVGVSVRLWKMNFGASYYKDDTLISEASAEEDFYVSTYTAGTRLGNFSLDYGVIKSKIDSYSHPTNIEIYSGSYHYNHFLFNLAYRKEDSSAPEFINRELIEYKVKSNIFASIQYSINKHIIIGINHNYFLLRDIGFTATFFL